MKSVPSVSVTYARSGASTKANALGMRPDAGARLRETGRAISAYQVAACVGKEPCAHVHRPGQAAEPRPLSRRSSLCPRDPSGRASTTSLCHSTASGRTGTWNPNGICATHRVTTTAGRSRHWARSFRATTRCWCAPTLPSASPLTHTAWRPSIDRLIAVDEFHHVSANPDNKLGTHLGQFIARGETHIVAMTGSYFRGDAEAVLSPSGRGEVRHRHLHVLRTAQRLRIPEAARYRLFLLQRLLCR